MAEAFFGKAEQAEKVAASIIESEEEFAHLRDQRIVFCGVEPAPKVKGKTRYGTEEVVTGKNAYLYWSAQGKSGGPFFRIVISTDLWELLSEDQRRFLVRHELRHCGFKTTKKKRSKTVRPHDIELFLSDLSDPCMEQVCEIWAKVQSAAATSGQMEMETFAR